MRYGRFRRNQPQDRGAMLDEAQNVVEATAHGGPFDGQRIPMQHVWTLGRKPVELAGFKYVLTTDAHGWRLEWFKEA